MLQAGIVGLPNVGKSTLFNALTKSRKAESENYPFCTIEPNVGVVQVPDNRLEPLRKIASTNRVIPAAIEFVDIAGLVAGASKGEGLGNQFLATIRNVDAIVQVVRCFDDSNIIHSMGSVDPLRDIEVITTEIILADLASVESQYQKNLKKSRSSDKEALFNVSLLKKLEGHLNEGNPINTLALSEEESLRLPSFCLLSAKPILYACNVSEEDLENPENNQYVEKVNSFVEKTQHAGCCIICASLEAEMTDLSDEEIAEYKNGMGIKDSGVSELIRQSYNLLGLASYFTAGEKEVRAWTFSIGMKAPQCAGVIHTDFEKKFIKAEVVHYEDLVAAGSYHKAREAGRYRMEGKDYVFNDGDVAVFRTGA